MKYAGHRSPRVAAVVCVALVASLSVTVLPAPSAHADSSSSAPADAPSAPDESTALQIAQRYGHAVSVDPETTDTSIVSAQPDGSFQLEADSLPVRVQQSGRWVPVDTSLSVDAGWLAPAAAAAPVKFSDGGSQTLAQVEAPGGSWISESWPYGELPQPTVSGSSATYPDVLPGVDLRLAATASGMSEVLVVKSKDALSDPQLPDLQLAIHGASSVSAGAQDSTVAKAPDGTSAVSASPQWWDSAHAGSGPAGPGGDAGLKPVDDSISGGTVSLNLAPLSAPGVTFPAYVDPDWTTTGSPFWFTDAAYPDQSYLNGQYSSGTQSVGAATDSTGSYRSDAFWQMSLSAVAGATVSEAVFNTTQVYAGTCSPTAIDIHAYGEKTAGFTWNQEQSYGASAWGGVLQSQNPNYGCPGVASHTVGWTVTSAVAPAVARGAGSIQLGLTADDAASQASRRHYSQSASLTITYDHPPAQPTNLSMTAPPRGCGTAANPAFVNNKVQPLTLSASVSDPDGGNINANFDVYKTSALTTTVWSHNKGDEPTGTITDTVPAGTLLDGTYAWRVLAGDRVLLSPYSAYCYFTVDNTAPALPTITADAGPYTVGTPFDVTFTSPASDNVAVFAYWWTDGAKVSPSPTDPVTTVDKTTGLVSTLPVGGSSSKAVHYVSAAGGTSATVAVAPLDNISTLWVAAYDKAGNVSTDAPASPPSSASGVEVDAADDPSVSYESGHGWIDDSVNGVISDRNTSAPLDLTLGAGLGNTVYNPDQGVSAISLPGYLALTRTVNAASAYDTVVEGAVPSGYAPDAALAPNGLLGMLLPPGSTAYDSTTMRAFSNCARSGGDYMSTVYASTECPSGTGIATLQGYLWDAPADVPAGMTAVPLYRCYANSHYFDTFDSTCDGTGVHASGFGYLASTGVAQTSGPAVDTTKSFTMSAWVYANADTANNGRYYAALSQSGAASYGYILDIRNGVFNFCVRSQVSVTAMDCAVDPVGGRTGAWHYVTGIFDAVSGDVRLIVDGGTVAPTAVAHHATPAAETSAGGVLMIGSAVLSGSLICQWDGEIADVAVFPGVIDSPQLRNLQNTGTP